MPASEPSTSVVIPTYQRPEQLIACLDAVSRLDYPRTRLEVIVVNDGGAPPPEAELAALRERVDLTVVTQRNAGPAAARNAGAARASGEVIAFTDDDCAPEASWLRALVGRLTADPECMVGGRTVNALPGNAYATGSQLLVDYLYAYYNRDRARFFTSNNFALAASRYRELGGFDTTFPRAAGEDRDLCDRWCLRGYRMAYAPDAVVRHAHAMTLRAFSRQHFDYGRAAYSFHRARAARGQRPLNVEPLSFYLRMLAYPFARRAGRRAPALAALLAVSQATNAAGFFWARLAGES
jgi:GT2 family glycosyltransferase